MSPTARTLKLLRAAGYTAQVVERFNIYARIRQDLFGCIDVVAIRSDLPGVLGVQCTSAANAAARLKKAMAEPALRIWLESGNAFEVHSHAKRGARGARKLWTCERRPLSIIDLEIPNESTTLRERCTAHSG